jgi:hypothetical protein
MGPRIAKDLPIGQLVQLNSGATNPIRYARVDRHEPTAFGINTWVTVVHDTDTAAEADLLGAETTIEGRETFEGVGWMCVSYVPGVTMLIPSRAVAAALLGEFDEIVDGTYHDILDHQLLNNTYTVLFKAGPEHNVVKIAVYDNATFKVLSGVCPFELASLQGYGRAAKFAEALSLKDMGQR